MVNTSRSKIQGAIVRLVITAVERDAAPDGTPSSVSAVHGLNGQRRWRLPLADALLAGRTGRYVFEVQRDGQRQRADWVGESGSERLVAIGRDGNLLDLLPEVLATERS